MSSTRNKNTAGNFELENNQNKQFVNTTISDSRIYEHNYIPGNGLLGAAYPLDVMAHNQVDIESTILGIGSTNLVEPNPNTINLGDFKTLNTLNICNKTPTIMPTPLVVAKNQRF